MLTQYQTDTQRLLQNPVAPQALYDTTSINRWINIARGQVAGEGNCIRAIGTISTVLGQREYQFTVINTGSSPSTGIDGVIHVRRVAYAVGTGQKIVYPRSWEWFDQFAMNNPVPANGAPRRWAQYGQGAAGTTGNKAGIGGSIYLDPPPDTIYTLLCDCVCFPVQLGDDTTVERLPYLWTDAVPYFAAYMAYLSSQTGTRQADAARMYELYKEFMGRARGAANPSNERWMYQQSVDPAQAAKIIVPRTAAGGG